MSKRLTPSMTKEAIRARKYRLEHPEKTNASARKYRLSHREQCKIAHRKNYDAHKLEHKKSSMKWRALNPERYRENKRRWMKEHRKNNLSFKIECALRGRISAALKRRSGSKAYKTAKLLGCSMPDFIIYLESKFEIGMTWENYGRGKFHWHIDHIIPCAIFDLTKPEHQQRCFHFSNMQPLWEPENLRKYSKVPANFSMDF